jgi:uncharacterized protein (TIGR02266 family)
MVTSKPLEHSPKVEIIHKDIKETKPSIDIECLEMVFFQISSVINSHKDLNTILEIITRAASRCLKANRSTIFLLDPKSGILTIQFTHAPDPIDERVGLFEEREVAERILKENKPLLVGGRGKSADSFKQQNQERRSMSLMSIRLSFEGKTMGVLSLVLINDEHGFDERRLQLFYSFANMASIAMEMTDLLEKKHQIKSSRDTYDPHRDNILNQSQNPVEKESQRTDSRIEEIEAEREVDTAEFHERQNKKFGVEGTITFKEELGIERRKDERVETKVRVEFEGESSGLTKDLSKGGAFILSPNPAELGDEFILKLHMPPAGEPIEVDCKVVWTNKYGAETRDLPRGMGVKFLRLQPEVQKRMEAYIESVRKETLY